MEVHIPHSPITVPTEKSTNLKTTTEANRIAVLYLFCPEAHWSLAPRRAGFNRPAEKSHFTEVVWTGNRTAV